MFAEKEKGIGHMILNPNADEICSCGSKGDVMIELKEKYRAHDNEVKEVLKETFEFKNKYAAVVINDVNYWTFGELMEDIPEDYYEDDPAVMMQYQLKKIERHYDYYGNSDCYQGFLMPWYGTGVLASGFGISIVKNYKQDPAVY